MKKVVFSKRAFTSLCVEFECYDNCETGGILLGKFHNDVWYIYETLFSGINSFHSTAEFAYDTEYTEYEVNMLAQLYNTELAVIGIWHSHVHSSPFSLTDHDTNIQFAKLNDFGAVTMLIDKEKESYTIQIITPNGEYIPAKIEIQDFGDSIYKDDNSLFSNLLK